MKIKRIGFIFIFLMSINSFLQANEVDNLLEKVNQASNKEEKKDLIEELKKKLAQKNIKAREESDAIIKARQKKPLKIYDESSLNK